MAGALPAGRWLPWWALLAGPLGLAAALARLHETGTPGLVAAAVALFASVFAAVHHAELIAHKVGEPLGTLVLAIAVTIIEVSVILSLMLGEEATQPTLARDTVFAAVMIILGGIVGLCLLVGGARYREQQFLRAGAIGLLAALATLAVLTLVLPNYTTSVAGPYYSQAQLGFVAVVGFALYATVLLVQTVRHRDYFVPASSDGNPDEPAEPPPTATALVALLMLVVSLASVVLLAEELSHPVETAVARAGLPSAVVGVAIALTVLLPEGLAALRAARLNRLQTSLNLALGSALATIGLTIPTVAVAAILLDLPIALGLEPKSIVLLLLALFVSGLTLVGGRTTILQGAVHLAIFGVYLLVTLVP
ncbi:MAG: calcium:proton antiporter [Sphingomonadaceae bacterium]